MADGLEVEVESDDLTALVRQIKEHAQGKAILKELRGGVRKSLAPAVPQVRSAIKKLPSQGESSRRGRPSLRKSAARATRLQVQVTARTAGATLRVDPKKMPKGQHNLPAYLNGSAPFQRWRHPVFGRDQYVNQLARPYFDAIVRRHQPAALSAVEAAMDKARRQLES